MSFYFYIVRCSDASYYIGHTDDVEKRISEHNNGLHAGYTSTRLPVKLMYSELFGSRADALVAEDKVKKWTRKKKEVLIKYGWEGFINKKHK